MRVYAFIDILVMAEKTDVVPVRIGSSPQEPGSPCKSLSPMHLMAGQAPDLTVKKRKKFPAGTLKILVGDEIYRMVVFAVMVAIKTDGRRIDPFREQVAFRNLLR